MITEESNTNVSQNYLFDVNPILYKLLKCIFINTAQKAEHFIFKRGYYRKLITNNALIYYIHYFASQ